MAKCEACEVKYSAELTEGCLNGHIAKFKTNTEATFVIADSGSPMSFLNEKKGAQIAEKDKSPIFKYIRREG